MSPIDSRQQLHGFGFMLGSCLLFGFTPLYLQWLDPLNGNLLFGYRVITQVIAALLILYFSRHWRGYWALFRQPNAWTMLAISSPLVGVQYWLFYWSPVNGYTIDLAMGYFLLPITLALTGRLGYGEPMRPLQWLALILVILAVLTELVRSGVFSWVTLLVCLGYPFYFILHRRIAAAGLIRSAKVTFGAENLLLLPFAVLLAGYEIAQGQPAWPASDWGTLLLIGLGVLGAVPMLFFLAASTRLSLVVFGLLNYLEPLLILLVALLFLGERIAPAQLLSYSLIALAVALVILNSALQLRRNR